MSTKKKKDTVTNKMDSEQIKDHVALFLKNGGKINTVATGTSGVDWVKGPKSIKLGSPAQS